MHITIKNLLTCAAASTLLISASGPAVFAEDYSGGSEEIYYYDDTSSYEEYDSGYTDPSYTDGSYQEDSYYTEDSYSSADTYDTGTYDTDASYTEDSADYTEDTGSSGTAEASQESADLPPYEIEPGEIITNQIPGWPEGPYISCSSAYLFEESTGTVLYSSNADEPYFPSSPVKIMTCLVALENCELSDKVVITETGLSGATDGGANISAQLDEEFTVEQLLYAVMLASANDACLQIAEQVGGTVDDFVVMMNDRAAALGCQNTHFTNPTGMTEKDSHTTAHDLALIMKAAMENDDFRTIASAQTYTIPATNLSGGERNLTNGFTMSAPDSGGYYDGCLAGKEGFTDASGSVLACAAERDGLRLYCAVMEGDADNTDQQAAALLDYGFSYFGLRDLGTDDFGIMDGGIVMVPYSAEEADIEYTDTPAGNGEMNRQYTFGGTPVGTATALILDEGEDPAIEEGQKNMQEALENSASLSVVPYIVIGGIAALAIGYFFWQIVKDVRRKPEDEEQN